MGDDHIFEDFDALARLIYVKGYRTKMLAGQEGRADAGAKTSVEFRALVAGVSKAGRVEPAQSHPHDSAALAREVDDLRKEVSGLRQEVAALHRERQGLADRLAQALAPWVSPPTHGTEEEHREFRPTRPPPPPPPSHPFRGDIARFDPQTAGEVHRANEWRAGLPKMDRDYD